MDFLLVPLTWRFNRSDVTFQLAALSFSKAFPDLLYTYARRLLMGERLLLEIPHLPRYSWNWQCASYGHRNVGRCSKTRLWAPLSQRTRWARTWLTSAPMDTSRCWLHFILSHSITCMLNVSVSCRGHDMLSKLLRFWKAWNSVISSIWVWGTR